MAYRIDIKGKSRFFEAYTGIKKMAIAHSRIRNARAWPKDRVQFAGIPGNYSSNQDSLFRDWKSGFGSCCFTKEIEEHSGKKCSSRNRLF